MSDTLHAHHPETIERTEQSSLDTAFRDAAEILADVEANPDFQAYLSDTNQKLNSSDAREYWGAIANFSDVYVGLHPELTSLEKSAFTLAATLPSVLTASYSLKAADKRYYPEKKTDKIIACTYNSLLKEFVTAFPQQSENLHQSLIEITLLTIGDGSQDFLNFADTQTDVTLKGIRHEIGYARFLEATAIPYRQASIEEDLKGKDIIITHPFKEVGIDVKASLSEVEAHSTDGSPSAYVVKQNGDVIMYSMVKESAFEGGFEPSRQYIADYAKGFGDTVTEAIATSIAKS